MNTSFQELPEALQNYLTDPQSSVFVSDFLKFRNKNTQGLVQQILEHISDCIYGSISIEEMLAQIKIIATLNEVDAETFFEEFLEVLGEDGLDELEKYKFNAEPLAVKQLFVSTPDRDALQPIKELQRSPEIVQSKLLQTLEQFNLHVDEKGIIAHEVERYLKGEVSSKDLVPHLTAMLDKPISEIHTIVNALNLEIFKPLQKQIAEEGALDISYDNDRDLENFLVQKRISRSEPQNTPSPDSKKDALATISFVPKKIQTVSQQEKDDVFADLRTHGGTPSGASLFSQETPQNILTTPTSDLQNIDIMPKAKKETYTIDPYRESI